MVMAMATAMQGYILDKIGNFSRILLFISSILIMYSETWSDIMGILITLIVFLVHYLRIRRKAFFRKDNSRIDSLKFIDNQVK
jgi:TRAP-type uncharacterized transport system fused permease subunit